MGHGCKGEDVACNQENVRVLAPKSAEGEKSNGSRVVVYPHIIFRIIIIFINDLLKEVYRTDWTWDTVKQLKYII